MNFTWNRYLAWVLLMSHSFWLRMVSSRHYRTLAEAEAFSSCEYGYKFPEEDHYGEIQLIVFGDSLLDDHNFACAQAQLPNGFVFQPPYNTTGNTSNGKPFVYFLQQELASLDVHIEPRVYAYAGARATEGEPPSCSSAGFVPGTDVQVCFDRFPGLNEQVSTYLNDLSTGRVPSTHSIFIEIGSNDLLFADPHTYASTALQVGAALRTACLELVAAGALQVLVATLPPVELTPSVQAMLRSGETEAIAQVRRVILSQLQFEELGVSDKCQVVDVSSGVVSLLEELQADGWTVDKSCLDFTEYAQALVAAYPEPLSEAEQLAIQCDDPCRSFYWDSLHPTECGYQRVAMQQAPVFAELLAEQSSHSLQEEAHLQNKSVLWS